MRRSTIEYDPDASYIRLLGRVDVMKTVKLDDGMHADLDVEGIEILNFSKRKVARLGSILQKDWSW